MAILFIIPISLILIFLGMPIAFSLLAASLVGLLCMGGPTSGIVVRMVGTLDTWSWLALLLFILMGSVMNRGGITPYLVRAAQKMVGHFPGALSHVAVVANLLMAGMSGSMLADLSAVGVLLIPSMKEEGYPAGYSAAIIGASSILGPLIPPSIAFVIYGSLTGASIGRLFLGGVVPGFLITGSLLIVGYFISTKRKYPRYKRASLSELLSSILWATPALILPIVIIGGMRLGFFTPTEGGGVGLLYVVLVGFAVYRGLNLRGIYEAFLDGTKLSVAILLVVATAGAFSFAFSYFGIGQQLTQALIGLGATPTAFILASALFIILIGCFMDTTAIQLIFIPLFSQIVTGLKIDLIHYGVVFTLATLISVLTPPYGIGMFVLMDIADIGVDQYTKGILPFLIAIFLILLITVFFPQVSVLLPDAVFGK